MEQNMSGWKLILVWIACVILGAAAGFALGWVAWRLGFELLGSAIALVGAGVGGIIMFFVFLNWSEDRRS
jgi:ABC-type branched-subunit amino acid transport system permease subunit